LVGTDKVLSDWVELREVLISFDQVRLDKVSQVIRRIIKPIVFKHKHSASIRDFVRLLVGPSVGPSVHPHITLSAFFSAVCGWIDLKFGRNVYVDLLF
jgi:hypothetical protein